MESLIPSPSIRSRNQPISVRATAAEIKMLPISCSPAKALVKLIGALSVDHDFLVIEKTVEIQTEGRTSGEKTVQIPLRPDEQAWAQLLRWQKRYCTTFPDAPTPSINQLARAALRVGTIFGINVIPDASTPRSAPTTLTEAKPRRSVDFDVVSKCSESDSVTPERAATPRRLTLLLGILIALFLMVKIQDEVRLSRLETRLAESNHEVRTLRQRVLPIKDSRNPQAE